MCKRKAPLVEGESPTKTREERKLALLMLSSRKSRRNDRQEKRRPSYLAALIRLNDPS